MTSANSPQVAVLLAAIFVIVHLTKPIVELGPDLDKK